MSFRKPRQENLVVMLISFLCLFGLGCVTNNSKDSSPRETTSQKNLKRIALAFHEYACANDSRFPGNVFDKEGKPLLSWRVLLLPYLEKDSLYSKFKLSEAWDSEHNRHLVERIPEVFVSPRIPISLVGYTFYQGFSGPNALFRGAPPLKIGDITDGTSNTILVVESSNPVPWTKPEDIPFDINRDVPDFGTAYSGKPLAALLDGSVRVLDLNKISRTTLKSAITPAGGEILAPDWE